MIVTKNGLGFSDASLKSGTATATITEIVTLDKNDEKSLTRLVLINDGYMDIVSMGAKVRVESYYNNGSLILVPNNARTLTSTTSSITELWDIPDGATKGKAQVTMDFSPTEKNVVFTFKTWGLVTSGIKTTITLENAVVHYNYEGHNNVIEIDQDSVQLYKNTTAHGALVVGGDVSIGGSLTIPSNKSIVVDKLESGSVVISSMTGGSVIISNKTGGTAQINGVIIEDSGGGESTTITVPRGDEVNSTKSGYWYYVPSQNITYGTWSFPVPETVIKGGSSTRDLIYTTTASQAAIKFYLVSKDSKIQLEYWYSARGAEQSIYYDNYIRYYETDVKFA